MEQMSLKRNPFVIAFFLVFILIAAGYISYSFILPRYIEKRIFLSVGSKLSTPLSGNVFSIGINESSFGNIVVGETPDVSASIGSIIAEYSLTSILGKKINTLRINGFAMNLEYTEGKISIPGLDIERLTAKKNKNPRQTSAIKLPLQLDNLQVSNGLLRVSYENHPVLIPFDLQIKRTEQVNNTSQAVYDLRLQILPQGEELTISGQVDPVSNKGKITLVADSLAAKPFDFLMSGLEQITSTSKVSIKSEADFRLIPFQVIDAEIDTEIKHLNFKNILPAIPSSDGSGWANNSFRLNVKGNVKQWEATLKGSIAEPISATLDLDGSFKQGANAINALGSLLLKVNDGAVMLNPDHLPFFLQGKPELQGDFSGNITPTGSWLMKVESSDSNENLAISSDHISVNSKIPTFSIQGTGSPDFTQMDISLTLHDIQAKTSGASEISLPVATLQSVFNQQISGQKKLSNGEFTILLPGLKFKKETLKAKADISFTGTIKPQIFQDMKSLHMEGELVLKNAKAVDRKSGVAIESIKGIIPWQWAAVNIESTGELKISGITWRNNELGSLDADIIYKNPDYLMSGKFSHTLPRGVMTNINGKARMLGSEYKANLTLLMEPGPFDSINLGKFEPSMDNAYLDGELGLKGVFELNADAFKGEMSLQMLNGRLEYPEKEYTIENINLNLLLPSLPDIYSAPAQIFLFDKASIGNLTIEHGKVIWKLESTDSFFIEQGVVNWAGGRVFMNSVRISPQKKKYTVPIFCDRLILTEILNQFGVVDAEGEGTVSGRIPMFVGEDTIRFEDGFLYSSPGQGGTVKVAALDILSEGIPKNTPQFSQVDFAAAALKNFQYNWVKLLLNSEGEELVMQMQMDGKPLQTLPFSYDSQTGQLQRLDDNTKGISQPIRLDVNFRLPLNRLLGYGGKIQDFMEKIQ